jgi:hypothetical protein
MARGIIVLRSMLAGLALGVGSAQVASAQLVQMAPDAMTGTLQKDDDNAMEATGGKFQGFVFNRSIFWTFANSGGDKSCTPLRRPVGGRSRWQSSDSRRRTSISARA